MVVLDFDRIIDVYSGSGVGGLCLSEQHLSSRVSVLDRNSVTGIIGCHCECGCPLCFVLGLNDSETSHENDKD